MSDLRVVVVGEQDVYGYFNSYGAAEAWALANVRGGKFVIQPLTVLFPIEVDNA